MRVHDHKIGCDLIPRDNESLWKLCKNKRSFSVLQGAGRFIADTLTEKLARERKRIFVLYYLIAVADYP